jgi:hypothetical protein
VGKTPVVISNRSTQTLSNGPLRDYYRYGLDDGEEDLLGLTTRISADSHVVRFSTLRNGNNCFLQKMIEQNNIGIAGKAIGEFTVRFAQRDYLISPATLYKWHVDESFGVLTNEPLLSLDDIVAARALNPAHAEYSPGELLALDLRQDLGLRDADQRSVETSTFVFNQGFYQYASIV